MAELTVRFDVKFSARMLRWAMAAAMVLAAAPELASESVSLSTYYPAPSGVYTLLIATSNTFLARDSGYLDVGTSAAPAAGTEMVVIGGDVGIGTLSAAAGLDVAGGGFNSGMIHVSGNTGPTLPVQGGYIGWNAMTGGTGEMDFMNNRGGGTGGFTFMNGVGNNQLTITGAGNVGIGTTGPVSALDVANGAITALAYQPNYSNWATYGTGAGGAAIYNDAGTYQTLMLVGNASNGIGRQVSVWDELNVQGNVLVNSGNQTMTQNNCGFVSYTPGVTNCPAGQYATNVSGMDVRWVALGNLPSQDASGGGPGAGEMLCCTCAITESRLSTAPGDGVGTGPGGCPSF